MINKPLQKWVLKRYYKLWAKFSSNSFNFKEAQALLGDREEILSIVLSELRRRGRLETSLDKKDALKRVYKLKSFDEYIDTTVKLMLKEIKA
jgi:hypothetical protein